MTVGASLFCLVAGAILTFAIETDSAEGINVNNVGIILMVVGLIGLAVYGLVWGSRTTVGSRTVIEEAPVLDEVVEVHERPVVRSPVRRIIERRTYR